MQADIIITYSMEKNSYQEMLNRLNTAQREAVESIEGPVMVLAGPGTGKTQILTLRIATILKKTDAEPRNILALTFTEAAANEMKERLSRIIGPSAYQVSIHTFHGFCNLIIQNNPDIFPHLAQSMSATDLDQVLLMEEILDSTEGIRKLKPYVAPYSQVSTILRGIAELKKEGVSPEHFHLGLVQEAGSLECIPDLYYEKGAHKGKLKGKYKKRLDAQDKNKELSILYTRYQDELKKRKLYDFNDMILEVLKALEADENFLRDLQEQYMYILIDEHQDTNAAQNRIIEKIASFHEDPNVFVVGDEKQAIYRFQGASLENFLFFNALYTNAKKISLIENYRSTQSILNSALGFIKHNPKDTFIQYEDLALHSQQKYPESPVRVISTETQLEELHAVADSIKAHLSANVVAKEIAVLTRKNSHVFQIADILKKEHIPYYIESDTNILNDFSIRQFLLLFRSIALPEYDEYLAKVLFLRITKINPIDAHRLIQVSRHEKKPLWDVVQMIPEDLALTNRQAVETFSKTLESWITSSKNEKLDVFYIRILHESGLLAQFLASENALETVEKCKRLYDEVCSAVKKSPDISLPAFLEYLTSLTEHSIALKTGISGIKSDGVRLMTAHKSKGLEFEYVYILRGVDRTWGNMTNRGTGFTFPWEYMKPAYAAIESEDKNEDERRLFFVALTRAKKQITITVPKLDDQGKQYIPSGFLVEIDQSLLSWEAYQPDKTPLEMVLQSLSPSSPAPDSDKETFGAHVIEQFRKEGLSATVLNNYLECPWKFVFRDMMRIPEVTQVAQYFGIALHEVLKRFFRHKTRTEVKVETLLSWLEEEVIRQSRDTALQNRLIQEGSDLIVPYYERLKNFQQHVESEVFIQAQFETESIPIKGKIDLIEFHNEDNTITVYDFKTGTPVTRNTILGTNKNSKAEYLRQLMFYTILLQRSRKYKQPLAETVLEFLKLKNGASSSLAFSFTTIEMAVFEEQINSVIHDILNLSFWNSYCDDNECEYCLLRKSMII